MNRKFWVVGRDKKCVCGGGGGRWWKIDSGKMKRMNDLKCKQEGTGDGINMNIYDRKNENRG